MMITTTDPGHNTSLRVCDHLELYLYLCVGNNINQCSQGGLYGNP